MQFKLFKPTLSRRILKRVALAAPLGVWALSATAADTALILGTDRYDALSRVSGADRVASVERGLAGMGFTVIARREASQVELEDAWQRFVASAIAGQGVDESRLVVVINGRFVSNPVDSYFLASDASPQLDVRNIDGTALSLNKILAVMAHAPGKALIVLGDDGLRDPAKAGGGVMLAPGLGAITAPQGVSVLTGAPGDVSDFTLRSLAVAGRAVMQEGVETYALTASGFAPKGWTLDSAARVASATATAPAIAQPANPAPAKGPSVSDLSAWRLAQSEDTVGAYQGYLQRFPDGHFAADAQRLMAEAQADPFRKARVAEESLSLSRDARREIQRQLSLLGYDPRGIDGLFGPGTRTAIGKWQKDQGQDVTTFLDHGQMRRLRDMADRRAAELEAEAEKRKLEQEREDRAYWEASGRGVDEVGLRAYLKRYPDGLFAELASERLARIDGERQAQAAAADRAAWDRAEVINSVDGYREYLAAQPNGAFRDAAQTRIDAASEPPVDPAWEAGEAALNMNAGARRLVEDKLNRLDLKPGTVDGTFDAATRRAIRRYQTARDLSVTGYLNQDTVVRLLADSIFQ